MTKHLTLVCEAKLVTEKAGSETGLIEATVTTWGAREGADGRRFFYKPEGFMEWASNFAKEGRPLPMFVNHESSNIPVGEWTDFEMTENGMNASGRLYMSTQQGKDLYAIMKESPRMFGGVSVGAYADEARYVDADGNEIDEDSSLKDLENSYFQITKGGLREVSVVMYPNNPQAEVMKLESCFDADGLLNPRVLEKQLRDAGVPKKDATTASSIFKRVLEQRDAAKKIEETPQKSESNAVVEEADAILKALEERELLKALDKRIK